MSHVPHELHDEFPDDAAIIRELKARDAHFQRLADAYHEVNRQVHRAETHVEPTSDQHLEDLKKQRLSLLDDLARFINSARV